ncbi:MAG: acyclic terpene utilization AtuA family protein [Candidatus Tectomicrobia bacterium]|nr:acyclic terpene utilization AtuA family protein [Candidatus Tectomicrobia bacterium]
MEIAAVDELRVLSVCGNLGYGFPVSSLENGIARNPHYMGADNGSTDAGPYYLGSGDQLTKREQIVRDLGHSLAAARRKKIPYIIGSAGTAGGNPHVDAVLDVMHQLAKRDGHRFRLAVIRAEMDKESVKRAVREGRIRSLGKLPPLTEEAVDESARIVGQMGLDPFIRAVEGGAEVVLAGRSCDTAIYTSYAAMRGFDLGLAFHMSKIIECGAQCALPIGANDCILGTLREDHFELEPMNAGKRLTPSSVAAHMMYEQPDPYLFYEPEGMVDLKESRFEQLDGRRVKVWGSRFVPAERPTIKLEGVRLRGYRTITVAGMTDPILLQNIDEVEARVKDTVASMVRGSLGPGDYELRFIFYGRDGVMGRPGPDGRKLAHEVGVVVEAIAKDQATANSVLSLARSTFLHCGFAGRKATAGNLAFPFSPSDFQGGPVYEFHIYHLMEVEDAGAPFEVSFEQVG